MVPIYKRKSSAFFGREKWHRKLARRTAELLFQYRREPLASGKQMFAKIRCVLRYSSGVSP